MGLVYASAAATLVVRVLPVFEETIWAETSTGTCGSSMTGMTGIRKRGVEKLDSVASITHY